MEKVLLVTTMTKLGALFAKEEFRDFEVVGTVTDKDSVLTSIQETSPDVVLFVEGVPSRSGLSTEEVLLNIKNYYPDLRVVFLAGEYSPADNAKCIMLSNLVKSGLYDIVTGAKISGGTILEALNVAKTYEDVKYLVRYDDTAEAKQDESLRNMIAFYSVKPGSGKSTIAVNTAIAIAKFGQTKRNGRAPRVAIVDGDLNNLSVGPLLHAENPQFNLREALRQVATVVDENGVISANEQRLESVRTNIRKCFVHVQNLPNLFALVSSEIPVADLAEINQHQFRFLLQSIYSAFDVVIVDMNSSLEHRTTKPIFDLASRVYFVIDPDYNNIKNNLRYQRELEALGVKDKIRYIMNRYIADEVQFKYNEDLDYSLDQFDIIGLDITNTIPNIDVAVMSNRVYKGIPIVLDNGVGVKEAKLAIFKIANENWKINYSAVNEFENPSKPEKEKKEGLVTKLSKKLAGVED